MYYICARFYALRSALPCGGVPLAGEVNTNNQLANPSYGTHTHTHTCTAHILRAQLGAQKNVQSIVYA